MSLIPKNHLLLLLQALAFFFLTVQSQDETSFAFYGFLNQPDVTYQEGAHVYPGTALLSLTQTDSPGHPVPSTVGRVLYTPPVQLRRSSPPREAAFETVIGFGIYSHTEIAADGVAFFIAPVNATFPAHSADGRLGIYSDPPGSDTSIFAVEFDTFPDPWDPADRRSHVGINVDGAESRVTTEFNSARNHYVTAIIRYDPGTRNITVAAYSDWEQVTLSYVFDLKTVLPEQVQVGISSSAGAVDGLNGLSIIHFWSFASTFGGGGGTDLAEDDNTYIRQTV